MHHNLHFFLLPFVQDGEAKNAMATALVLEYRSIRTRRRGISNDPGHLHILSGVRAYIPRWRDRIERVTLPCACIQLEAWRGLGRIRRVFAISCQLSNMTWSRVVWGRRQMRTLRSLAILEKELIASLSWLLIRPQSPSG